MKRVSNQAFGLALLAGVGIGIGCGYLMGDEHLRSRIGKKMRKIGRACRYQTAELRETANELLEKGERNLKEARDTGRRIYQKLAV